MWLCGCVVVIAVLAEIVFKCVSNDNDDGTDHVQQILLHFGQSEHFADFRWHKFVSIHVEMFLGKVSL